MATTAKQTKVVPLRAMARKPTTGEPTEIVRARVILQYAHDSAKSFLDAFETVRKARGVARGAPTDEEQDLLRAMVVIVGAGLDSMAGQLVRNALPAIASRSDIARAKLQDFAESQIGGTGDGTPALTGQRLLARALLAKSSHEVVLKQYIVSLTWGSLQSTDQLARVAAALGAEPPRLGITKAQLGPVFRVRNDIIHKLDIDFDHPNRNRTSRAKADMITHANCLLAVGEALIDHVAGLLS
jgi:hypothetical protein